MKNKRFTKNDLIKHIKSVIDCEIFYVSGYDDIMEYIQNNNGMAFVTFLKKNLNKNTIFVSFNPRFKRYYIAKTHPNEYVYVYNDKKTNLKNLTRFFNKSFSLDNVSECHICYEDICSTYSECVFNMMTYTCHQCFNTICISCFIKQQEKDNTYTCPYCKVITQLTPYVDVYMKNNQIVQLDRKRYNDIMLEIDTTNERQITQMIVQKILDS